MEKLEALLRGRHAREELVFAVREDYEKIVCEIEKGDNKIPTSVVRWPKKNTLCFPVFLDQGKQLTQENEGDGEHTEPATAPHKHLGTETQPPQERDDSVSVSPLSSLSSESQQEDTPIAAPSAPQTDSDREEEKEMGDSALLSETANVLLHSGPLVRGDLPEDKESLQNLKIQTEMELMWLRQAIDSRRKYLQLKDQINEDAMK